MPAFPVPADAAPMAAAIAASLLGAAAGMVLGPRLAGRAGPDAADAGPWARAAAWRPLAPLLFAAVPPAALAGAPGPADLAAACVLGWTLAALALTDLARLRLPDVLTLPLLALGLAEAAWRAPWALGDRLAGAVAGFAALWAVNAAYRALRGREGLGLGDAKLLAALGAWLGWQVLPALVLLAAGGALVAVLALMPGAGARQRVPFGAFLGLAGFAVGMFLAAGS